jgi:hypothetical protein
VNLTSEGAVDACAVADYDNDERPDIALASANKVWLFHNDGNGTFSDTSSKAAIPAVTGGWAQSLAFIDIDHDADVDLVVTGAKTMLFRNNGNGTFSDATDDRGLRPSRNTAGVIASDLNNDRAIDLVLTGDTTTILLNPREGAFKPLDAFKPAAPPRHEASSPSTSTRTAGWTSPSRRPARRA